MQSDLPVPSVAYINDALRSEKLHCDASKNCSRKDLFREALSSSSCLQPNFLIKKDSILTTSDQKKIKEILARYKKIVVKPADSSGSRGVRFLNSFSQEDLTSAIQYALSFSQAGVVVMEGFISGLEFGAQTLSNNGKCVKVFAHSDVMDPSGRVPLAHRYPHPDFTDDQIKKIEYEIAKAVEAIGIQYGPTNVDCILDEANNVYVVEIGARIGATCLPELTSIYSGIDWINLSIGISSQSFARSLSIEELFDTMPPLIVSEAY